MVRHFPTLHALWANKSFNHVRNLKNPQKPASSHPRTTLRSFSHSEKLRIVEAADRCTKPGELGLLLRSEGLFSSHLANWRRWRLRVHPTIVRRKPLQDWPNQNCGELCESFNVWSIMVNDQPATGFHLVK